MPNANTSDTTCQSVTKATTTIFISAINKSLLQINEGVPCGLARRVAEGLLESCAVVSADSKHPTEDLAYLIRFVTNIASDLIEACSEAPQ